MIKTSLTLSVAALAAFAFSANAEETALFNGKDLSGWTGDESTWSVVDGVVTGVTSDETPLEYNQFLILEGEPVGDFTLTVEMKLTGNNNSGTQYRAQLRPDLGDYVVSGYQCDMHAAEWANGMLYDEKGRGILCKRGSKVVLTPNGDRKIVGELPATPVFDPSEWNTYTITAKGNHLVHAINGVPTAEIWDHDEENRDLSGVIAFQVHKGPAMKIELRNALLTRLNKAELVAPEATPIPEGAADVLPPKKKKKG